MAARVDRSEVLTSLGVVLMLAALVAAFRAGNSFDPVQDWQTSLTFVLGAVVGGAGIARENAARHARLFRSVAEVIDGDATASNKLEGWYRGRRVTLTICPASASAVSMGSYTLCLDVLPTGTSWKLRYGRQGGFGPKRWYVSTPEDTKATVRAMVASATFRDRLTEAGAVSAVEAWRPRLVSNVEWGDPEIKCRSFGRCRELCYSVAVRDGLVDQIAAEQFTAQLELLTNLAELDLKVHT